MSQSQPEGEQFKFPNDVVFNQLLRMAQEFEGTVIDEHTGFKADYNQFLYDVCKLRELIQAKLPPHLGSQGIIREDRPWVGLIATLSYEFAVAFFAIIAVGGAVMPLSRHLSPTEVEDLLHKADNAEILVAPRDRMDQATAIKDNISQHDGREIITIATLPREKAPKGVTFSIDHQLQLSLTRPGYCLQTSGTTGRPKCVVFLRGRLGLVNPNMKNPQLAFRPPDWAGGLRVLVFSLLQGQKIYILPLGAGPEVFWRYIRDFPLGIIWAYPRIFREMMEYFEQHISKLPQNELDAYIQGLKKVEGLGTSGSMIGPRNLQFWRNLLGDVPIFNTFATTEVGLVFKTRPDSTIKSSVGVPIPGTSIKLSEGDHGELSVKSPRVFAGYLNDDEATKRAFDDEGYVRTGDLMRRAGDEYVFEGRASTDFVHVAPYQISITELESHLLDLPYISEAYVIGVPHHESKQVVAAIVRLNDTESTSINQPITLQRINDDLSKTLPAYKLLFLLRILHDGEQVPYSPTGKPIKKGLLKQFFNIDGFLPECYEEPGVECSQSRYNSVTNSLTAHAAQG